MLRFQRRSAQELFSKADSNSNSDSARQTNENGIDRFNWHTNRIPGDTP
jgi:hypothetical protein